MHWPALARAQRWTIRSRRSRTRALENRLAWNRTSRSRTHRGSRGRAGRRHRACRRSWPQGRLINRTRPRLRNDHSWQRRGRRRWCAWGDWSGSHGRPLRRRGCGLYGRCNRCSGTGYRPRRRNRRSSGSRRRWSHGSRRLRRCGRCRSRKSRPRAGSWNHKFRRSGRSRRRCLRSGNGRGWRGRRDRGLALDGRRRRWSVRDRGSLLFADDGL